MSMINLWLGRNRTMPWTRYRCDTTSDRDNETKEGKYACEDEMLKELDVLEPKGISEKVDRLLVRTIIGAMRKLGWGIEWSNELADELHKSIRKKFKKRRVFASGTDAIWTANLVDMQSVSRSYKDFK